MRPLLPEDERRFQQLRQLTELSRALTSSPDVEQVIPLATARAAEMFGAQTTLLLLTDEEGLLRVRASHGVSGEALERFRAPLSESVGESLLRILGSPAGECFLGVPLIAGGAVTGVLGVMRPGAHPASDEEEWLLSAVADQVAVALDNARLARELRDALAEQARAERGADAADEARDRALATLSHDLRSPLNAIDSFAELMEMEILGPIGERQREALGRIRMSGRHLLAVLENVLEMARLNAGVVRVQMTSVPLEQVVVETILMVRHSAAAREQELRVEAGPEATVAADPDRLRQILINVVGNAVKYTPQGGLVRVSTSLDDVDGRSWGCVAVADTGPGIAPDQLDEIFRPYYRIPGSETTSSDGAGLGLAISRELIRQMGGEIEVESEPGSGSTFRVRLPLAPSAT